MRKIIIAIMLVCQLGMQTSFASVEAEKHSILLDGVLFTVVGAYHDGQKAIVVVEARHTEKDGVVNIVWSNDDYETGEIISANCKNLSINVADDLLSDSEGYSSGDDSTYVFMFRATLPKTNSAEFLDASIACVTGAKVAGEGEPQPNGEATLSFVIQPIEKVERLKAETDINLGELTLFHVNVWHMNSALIMDYSYSGIGREKIVFYDAEKEPLTFHISTSQVDEKGITHVKALYDGLDQIPYLLHVGLEGYPEVTPIEF